MTIQQFQNMSLNDVSINDRYFHKFIQKNYEFMFNGSSNDMVNYRDQFWVVNDLNLMNYMQFTKMVARQYYYKKKAIDWGFKGYTVEDFENEALTALPLAASKFKYNTQLHFQNYLQFFIRNALARLKSYKYVEIDKFDNPDKLIGYQHLNYDELEVDILLKLLTKREQFILRHFYGIGGAQQMSLQQIADHIGVHARQVSYIKRQILIDLRLISEEYHTNRGQWEKLRKRMEIKQQIEQEMYPNNQLDQYMQYQKQLEQQNDNQFMDEIKQLELYLEKMRQREQNRQ